MWEGWKKGGELDWDFRETKRGYFVIQNYKNGENSLQFENCPLNRLITCKVAFN